VRLLDFTHCGINCANGFGGGKRET
jgi:hypothetical protein